MAEKTLEQHIINYYYIILCIFMRDSCQEGISWTVKQPVVLGTNVKLVCNTSCCGDNDKDVGYWNIITGNISTTIYLDGKSRNTTKYRLSTDSTTCSLVIRDFYFQDFNSTYTCFRHFMSYSKNLSKFTDFEIHPTKNTTINQIDFDENQSLRMYCKFSKVFPLPKCSLSYNEKNLTSELMLTVVKIGRYYAVEYLYVGSEMEKGSLLMVCDIGTFEYTKEFRVILLRQDLENWDNHNTIVIGILLMFTVMLFLPIIPYYVQCVRGMSVILYLLVMERNPSFPAHVHIHTPCRRKRLKTHPSFRHQSVAYDDSEEEREPLLP